MEISQNQFESILKTLPIGYYFGHNAPVELTMKDMSFCDLDSETIYISYPAIKASLESVPSYDPEKQIRAHLYHELSHLILTPVKLPQYALYAYAETNFAKNMALIQNIMNIFEDERIESIFKNYYFNVDFWESTCMENPIPDNPDNLEPLNKFFLAVRLHRYPSAEVRDEIYRIIRTYRSINSNCASDSTGRTLVKNYCRDVFALYTKYFANMPQQENPENQNMPQTNSDLSEQKQSSEQTQSSEHGQSASQNDEQELTENSDSVQPVSEEEGPFADIFPTEIEALIKSAAEAVLVNPQAAVIKTRFKQLLQTAMNKRAMQSASQTGYAGRIDPRLTGNRDYRWFVRQNSKGSGANRYSKIKINLFVDASGSFKNSQNQINAILLALRELNNEMPDFLFDVVSMGDKNQILTAETKSVICFGGNRLTHEIFSLYDRIQNPQARCINIAVFDGDAWSDIRRSEKRYEEESIGVFNHPNCILISNPDNEQPIRKYVKQARTIIIPANYSEVFTNEIFSALERLLA